jgi:hypothetical protein
VTNRSGLEEPLPSAALAAIESEIPATHPDNAAIEEAIRAAFAGHAGPYRVSVLAVQGTPWWVLVVQNLRTKMRRSALLDNWLKQRAESVGRIAQELARERRRRPRTLPLRRHP